MILRVKTHIKKKKTGYYDELIEAVWHNTADLRAQYLGSKLLLRKRYYHEFNRVIWHNNADLKENNTYPKIAEMTTECSTRCRR